MRLRCPHMVLLGRLEIGGITAATASEPVNTDTNAAVMALSKCPGS